MQGRDQLRGPLGAATRFLRGRLTGDRCFLRCVASDDSTCPVDCSGYTFVSFFVSEAIAADLVEAERSAILSRIWRDEQGGAWGYARHAPVDADDTAFVLRTLRNLGQPVHISGLDIFSHDGAFTTFELGPFREPAQLAFEVCLENNFRVHPEVLANVYRVLADANEEQRINEPLIRTAQAPEGYFRSYFYPGKYYGTWMVAELLAITGRLQAERDRALRFVAESQNQDGSWGDPGNAYETALALNICRPEEIDPLRAGRGVEFLVASQASDGSWQTCQPIWVFRHKDTPVVMWEAYDTNCMIATALAVKALRRHDGIRYGEQVGEGRLELFCG